MDALIDTRDANPLVAIRNFLGQLFERGIIEALYVPLETSDGMVLPALVLDPARLENANPLAPVMPINGARAVAALTDKQTPARLGAVLRPCELRALIELVKLQQASLENVVLICLDCPGTFGNNVFLEHQRSADLDLAAFLQAACTGKRMEDDYDLRQACRMCIQPLPEQAAIQFHLFGASLDQNIPITVADDLAERLSLAPAEHDLSARQTAIDQILTARREERERELGSIRQHLQHNGGIRGLFEACIRCHNCMTVCPICYCKTCLFKTAAFDHPPEHYFNLAKRKGALRMLGDTLLFHMTRLNHMSASCVSCGMCTEACPADIPVGTIFSAIGAGVQAVFEYMPGRSLAEPLPLVTFRTDEFTEIGETR